jgi:hypothetical protein
MKKLTLILIAAAVILSASAFSQSPAKSNFLKEKAANSQLQKATLTGSDYSFSHSTGAYTDLTGAIQISNNELWDDPVYVVPIGFNFKLFGVLTDHVYFGIGTGGLVSTKIINEVADYLIIPFEADLVDRGMIAGASQSPISYKTEGAAGNRIFKLEWKNAGFYNEWDIYETLNDYVNFQLWLYEATGDVEVHYGSSMITDAYIDYGSATGALIGLYDYNLSNAYLLSGPPNDPELTSEFAYLNGTPSDGTIYAFSKLATGIKNTDQMLYSVNLYPNPAHSEITLESENTLNGAVLTVLNSNGQQVRQISNIAVQKFSFNRDGLPDGLYFLRLTENSQIIFSSKIVLKD